MTSHRWMAAIARPFLLSQAAPARTASILGSILGSAQSEIQALLDEQMLAANVHDTDRLLSSYAVVAIHPFG